MEASSSLIIIPGTGDREKLYETVLPVWRHYGYDAQVFNFGWNRQNVQFKESLNELEELIVKASGAVALIGASAGGTAALHAGLRHPDKIAKIVAISTPLKNPELAKSELVCQSIDELESLLSDCNAKLLEEKTLSIYGLYDNRVAIRRSQYVGMPQLRLPVVGHSLIISSALTVFSARVNECMNNRSVSWFAV